MGIDGEKLPASDDLRRFTDQVNGLRRNLPDYFVQTNFVRPTSYLAADKLLFDKRFNFRVNFR